VSLNSLILTVGARIRSQGIACGICSEESGTGIPSVFPANIIPPLLHIHSCIMWRMDSGPSIFRNSGDSLPPW
jgi:hypothetical protein